MQKKKPTKTLTIVVAHTDQLDRITDQVLADRPRKKRGKPTQENGMNKATRQSEYERGYVDGHAEGLETASRLADKERETLIYWLLRCYECGHREGWETGASSDELMDALLSVLANRGYDPNRDQAAKELLKMVRVRH